MARPNPTEFAILGLLAEEPRSGYDIKKEVEERLSHFWSESYGHVYPMLHRLHERELVVKEVEKQEGKPDRNVYHITEEGRKALEAWFAEPPPPIRPRNEFLLRLFFGRHSRPEYLLRDIRRHGDGVKGALARLRAVKARIESEAGGHPDRVYWELVLENGLKALGALAEWSDEAEARLETLGSEGFTAAGGSPSEGPENGSSPEL
jgi:PadR family transcriptional regulator, regulatory protein AphA